MTQTTRPQPQPPALDRTRTELSGTIAGIRWYDPESGTVIATLRDGGTGSTIKGHVGTDGGTSLEVGTSYRFLGRWVTHHKHGDQFEFTTWLLDQPSSHAGVIKYLEKVARNVGKARAARLFEEFGPDAVVTLRTNPHLVAQSGIMPLADACAAAESLEANATHEKVKIDLHGLFVGRGFPAKLQTALINDRRWGLRAGELVRRNPFRLLVERKPGCGFSRCDKLYLEFGRPADSLKRQFLCAWNRLREDGTGSTWFRVETIRAACLQTVGASKSQHERVLALGLRSRWLSYRVDASGRTWIAERQAAEHEQTIADQLRLLGANRRVFWPRVEALDGSGLTPHQLGILKQILDHPVCFLAGSPGVGKTYVAAAVIRYVVERFGAQQVMVAAPTGKAAVRITEAMAALKIGMTATTIHRALEIGRNGHDGGGWGFKRDRTNPIEKNFVFVDEASMIDSGLMANLLAACAPGTHVMFIGDPGQLSPVGRGCPQRDMLAAGIPAGTLTEIKRNDGLIVRACQAINVGKPFSVCQKYNPDTGDNLRWMEAGNEHKAVGMLQGVIEAVKASGRWDPVWDVQVLVAMNDKSAVSRVQLNAMLQGMLNPLTDTMLAAARLGPDGKCDGKVVNIVHPFRVGDKIMCLRNNTASLYQIKDGFPPANLVSSYERDHESRSEFVANGDLGRVLAVSPRVVVAGFDGPDRTVWVPWNARAAGGQENEENEGGDQGGDSMDNDAPGGKANDYALAYAITCHRFQGSEIPLALIMVDDMAGRVASREFNYTAISRAKKLCILIGKRATFDKQCRVVSLDARKTFLKEMIQEAMVGSKPVVPSAADRQDWDCRR